MSDKTKLTWLNGSVIKQGDTSSVFKLKLKTDDNVVLNGPAKIQLIQGQAKIEYEAEVVKNHVSFNLPKPLPVGDYIVEIEHAGYVFPSSNSVVLTVNENMGDVVTDEIVELLNIDDYINQKLADFQSGQINLEELASKLDIQPYDDSQIKAQIVDILSKLDTLEQPNNTQTEYDDSEIVNRLTTLENKTDNDTIYDDTSIKQRLESLESRPEVQSYDDTEVKSRLTALEQSSGSNSTTNERFGPTGWFLDRSTDPWTIHFDNGCKLQLPDYPKEDTVYGYGYTIDPYNTQCVAWPIIGDILSYAHGSLTLESLKDVHGGFDYWGDRSTVINPVQDASNIDFTNARFNNNVSTYYTDTREKNKIRVFYELGLFTKSDILSLGATEI
ncbi:hypothetical protein [Streptococcus hyovaginalis]|uniref:hypothetical protein n=1 Tax=Streptococcus hyovaginalis TaxID=149015 RepID=UPI003B3BCFA6